MKRNHVSIFLLFFIRSVIICLFFPPAPLSAQNYLTVHYSDGTRNNTPLNNVTKITFSSAGEQIHFHLADVGLVTRSTASIRKTTFDFSGEGTPLPVELINFSARANGKSVLLYWESETEVNSSKFHVERARAEAWLFVGEVNANGNSASRKCYSYCDTTAAPGKHSYRLKMIDNDGSFRYSSVVNVDLSLPAAFAVSQNYPNPFNPATTIEYQIPQSGKVSVAVYDISGKEIRGLFHGVQEAGFYLLSWDGKNKSGHPSASGVYVYQVAYNAAIVSRKMILVK